MSTTTGPSDSTANLASLPAELLLEVFQYLTAIRGYLSIPEDEVARQEENAQRTSALYNLTLTCRRLNEISTPFLYSSMLGLGSENSWVALNIFLRTITEKPTLMNHVRYIETGWSGSMSAGVHMNGLKFRLTRLREHEHWASLISEHPEPEQDDDPDVPFLKWGISVLISLAHNLQSLGLLNSWQGLLILVPQHNMSLRELFIGATVDFPRFGCLRTPTVSAVNYNPLKMLMCVWRKGRLRHWPDLLLRYGNLQSVPIEEMELSGNWDALEMSIWLSRCDSLRRFTCRWTAGPTGSPLFLAVLREDLRRFENTLEYLVLDTLESSWLVALDEWIPTIGSLREFVSLKHIDVSGMVLWSDDENVATDGSAQHPPLSSILPPSLETMVVNVEWDYDIEDSLAGLARDCTLHLPNLKRIDCSWRPAPMLAGRDLVRRFEEAGVALKLDIAQTVEEEEARIEAELIQMEKDSEWLDERARIMDEELAGLAEG